MRKCHCLIIPFRSASLIVVHTAYIYAWTYLYMLLWIIWICVVAFLQQQWVSNWLAFEKCSSVETFLCLVWFHLFVFSLRFALIQLLNLDTSGASLCLLATFLCLLWRNLAFMRCVETLTKVRAFRVIFKCSAVTYVLVDVSFLC